jgi:hypothetical protein
MPPHLQSLRDPFPVTTTAARRRFNFHRTIPSACAAASGMPRQKLSRRPHSSYFTSKIAPVTVHSFKVTQRFHLPALALPDCEGNHKLRVVSDNFIVMTLTSRAIPVKKVIPGKSPLPIQRVTCRPGHYATSKLLPLPVHPSSMLEPALLADLRQPPGHIV